MDEQPDLMRSPQAKAAEPAVCAQPELSAEQTASVGAIPGSPSRVQAPAEESVGAAVAATALTPEEQMALFEKELKENDWGHQPC